MVDAPRGVPRMRASLVVAARSRRSSREVSRLVGLGATRIDTGRREAGWAASADPDGREFRVLTP